MRASSLLSSSSSSPRDIHEIQMVDRRKARDKLQQVCLLRPRGHMAGRVVGLRGGIEANGCLYFAGSPSVFVSTVARPLTYFLRPGVLPTYTLSTTLNVHRKQLNIALPNVENRSKQYQIMAAVLWLLSD